MAPTNGPGVVPATDMLATLKRFDPDVEQVLASSGHVCLYTMAVESQQWTRKDVEGSLFLLKRRGSPRFQMMVLNKLSTENYVEDIHGGLDFELNPPYLMYTHGNSEIIGVWFYEQDDLRRVEDILKRIKQTSQGSQSPGATAQVQAHQPAGGKSDDDGFYDKGASTSAAPAQGQAPQPQVAQRPSASVSATNIGPLTDGGSSNLANLLRNAQLKQQQAAAASGSLPSVPSAPLPQPLPPSFFAQQQQRLPAPVPAVAPTLQPQPVPAPVSAPAPAPAAPLPIAASQPQSQTRAAAGPGTQRISQVLPAAAAAGDQQPAGGQLGGPLAVLFANAHKAPQVQAPAAPPPPTVPPPQAAPPLQVAPGSSPSVALPVVAGSPPGGTPQWPPRSEATAAGASDEERVRRLLTRIATNDALLKMLATEMRAVGMLS